ncbi:MAG TPA: response regulator [Roseiflexaceae bacterium]|nr:response regulator [Roseiflexaceae bacterium]
MSIKILIVDDDLPISRLLMYQLRELGYQVCQAPDGLTALQRFHRERPDLVLLDVMMPDMSGWEVCRHIRAISQVPIIMLTAKASEIDMVQGLDAGADDYIAKPFKMPQLHARIEAVLRRTGERVSAPRPAERQTPLELAAVRPVELPPDTPTAVLPPVAASLPGTPMRLGPRLREARLARGMSLNDAGVACKVRWDFLQAIEQENFSYVPRAQLRLALHTYSSFLGLNLRELVRQAPAPRPQQPILQYAAVLTIVVVVIALTMLLLQ